MLDPSILTLATATLSVLRARGVMVATAESCTGGLIAAALTHVAGSSDVVDRGFVTYSNQAKTEMLGVDPALIERDGAVSEAVARSMAAGSLERSQASIAVAVTGIAGPGGGTADKPVGLVWFGLARIGRPTAAERHVFAGDRAAVRAATVACALRLLTLA